MQVRDVPVLILVFNRPDVTRRLMLQLQKIRPRQLFVGADGARKHKHAEVEHCKAVRHSVATHVNWDCELHTLYRDENLGCKNAVSTAIDWFFSQVAYGIILEDDCIPHPSFVQFCAELLEQHKDREQIMHIAGFNYFGKYTHLQSSYFYSNLAFVWGWATWRRAWAKMDINMKLFPEIKAQGRYKHLVRDTAGQRYMLEKWEETYLKKNDSWAYAWAFSIFAHGGLCIVPTYNLISNQGFNQQATNTRSDRVFFANSKTYAMDFPLKHPSNFNVSAREDKRLFYVAHKSRMGLWIRQVVPRFVLDFLNKRK